MIYTMMMKQSDFDHLYDGPYAVVGHTLFTHADSDGRLHPHAMREAVRLMAAGVEFQIVCCHPRRVRARYSRFGKYVLGDWDGKTGTRSRPVGNMRQLAIGPSEEVDQL